MPVVGDAPLGCISDGVGSKTNAKLTKIILSIKDFLHLNFAIEANLSFAALPL